MTIHVPPQLRPGYIEPPRIPPRCSRCTFWKSDTGGPVGGMQWGFCHRFPKRESAASSHWCGEFFAAANPAQQGDSE